MSTTRLCWPLEHANRFRPAGCLSKEQKVKKTRVPGSKCLAQAAVGVTHAAPQHHRSDAGAPQELQACCKHVASLLQACLKLPLSLPCPAPRRSVVRSTLRAASRPARPGNRAQTTQGSPRLQGFAPSLKSPCGILMWLAPGAPTTFGCPFRLHPLCNAPYSI